MKTTQQRIVEVGVAFQGTIRVSVPANLAENDARLLAEHVALSRVLATTENPDAPDDEAFADYQEACSAQAAKNAEENWDAVSAAEPSGAWSIAGNS